MSTLKQILHLQRSGATSLLVTVSVSMLLIVIIAGIAAFSIREQRQASNTELSNRALQTALAGVADGVQKLAADPTINQTSCQPVTDIFPDQTDPTAQQITCRTITTQFTSVESSLERDRATQLEVFAPSVAQGATTMQLRWHSDSLDKDTPPYAFTSNNFYPPTGGYNAASAIEITFVYWKRGSIQTGFLDDPAGHNNGLRTATRFFMPGRADQANPAVTSGCSDQASTNTAQLGDYRCVTNPDSAVGFNIKDALGLPDDPATYDYVVRIKPRYAGTRFQARFFNQAGQEVAIKSTKALIDVTAKAGDLYRRVQAEKSVIPTSMENLFDGVLYAGKGDNDSTPKNICKNLLINDQVQLVRPNSCE